MPPNKRVGSDHSPTSLRCASVRRRGRSTRTLGAFKLRREGFAISSEYVREGPSHHKAKGIHVRPECFVPPGLGDREDAANVLGVHSERSVQHTICCTSRRVKRTVLMTHIPRRNACWTKAPNGRLLSDALGLRRRAHRAAKPGRWASVSAARTTVRGSQQRRING